MRVNRAGVAVEGCIHASSADLDRLWLVLAATGRSRRLEDVESCAWAAIQGACCAITASGHEPGLQIPVWNDVTPATRCHHFHQFSAAAPAAINGYEGPEWRSISEAPPRTATTCQANGCDQQNEGQPSRSDTVA
jgi:hypothetical protein